MIRRLTLTLILPAVALAQSFSGPGPAPFARQAPAAKQSPPRAAGSTTVRPLSTAEFGKLVERISEPGGYFDTDNLISNEASYLHVLGRLRRMGTQRGAYIGVGPDQNFSYIAQIRPSIVYVVDIRRDNLLQHLLFKAIFMKARNRVEYLALLFGRQMPSDSAGWESKSIQQLVDFVDKSGARRDLYETTAKMLAERVRTFGVTLSDAEVATVGRIHQAFFEAGLDLRFTSRNRAPRAYYPTYRDLVLEKDLTGRHASYLANEADFQFLKALETNNLVIPVVGNFAGDRALAAIGRDAAERGQTITAFYTSNVEFYLMREGGFDRFVENLKRLPYTDESVIIRSYFSGGFGFPHPQSVPGYYSTQLLQTIESLVREYASGGYDSYSDLVTKHSLDLK